MDQHPFTEKVLLDILSKEVIMKLSDLFQKTQNTIQENVSTQDNGKSISSKAIFEQIRALTPGKVLQGEVVETKGNEVIIKLAGDLLLTARLDQKVNIEEGKSLFFEVKNNGKVLSLSPLFTNTSAADNVMKALHMAKIPVNQNTVEMTERMMKQGMSVDSHSLQMIFKDVTANEQVPVEQIVKLHQMQMPVNEANINQLNHYMDMTHYLTDGMNEVISSIPDTFHEILSSLGDEKAVSLYAQMLEVLSFSPENNEIELTSQKSLVEVFQKIVNTMNDNDLSVLTENGDEIITGEKLPSHVPVFNDGIKEVLSDPEKILSILSSIENGQIEKTSPYHTNLLRSLISLLKEPAVVNILQEQFKNQWIISPEQVADKEHVQEVYEKVRRQLESLKVVLDKNGAEQSTTAKGVNTLRQNIDFMHQLNQVYTYIQLPLMLNQKMSNGELYVFTNKRLLVKEKGSVSALLHLDMENLGMIDVYITMQDSKVNTRFTVSDDDMLDFLNDHMDVLTKHLSQKGYSMDYEMKIRDMDETKNCPLDLLSGEEHKDQISTQYAFDVRA